MGVSKTTYENYLLYHHGSDNKLKYVHMKIRTFQLVKKKINVNNIPFFSEFVN